jgi:hypothetical protein
MFSVPTQEELDKLYSDKKEKEAAKAKAEAAKAKKIQDEHFATVVAQEKASQAKIRAVFSPQPKEEKDKNVKTEETEETVGPKKPVSETVDLLHQRFSQEYYEKKKQERDAVKAAEKEQKLKSVETEARKQMPLLLKAIKAKGPDTTPDTTTENEGELPVTGNVEEFVDKPVCIDHDIIKRALTIIYGNEKGIKTLDILKCARHIGVPGLPPDEEWRKTTAADLKKGIIKELNSSCRNIYNEIDIDFFIKTFLNRNPKNETRKPDLKINLDILTAFFNRKNLQEISKEILQESNVNDIKTGVEKVQQILRDPIKNNSLNILKNVIENTPAFKPIIKNIGTIGQLQFGESNSKKVYLCLMFLLFYLAALRDIIVEINNNTDTGDINDVEMRATFRQTPVSLDARQLITVNRFTKYKKQNDKATFLFHGVGTGKTITSTTIALSYLTEENIFNIKGTGNENKKPLEILVICPQGLFFGAFAGDASKLGIYVYNKTVQEIERVEIKYTIETFEACVKIDKDSYYKLNFTGFDYSNLFKIHGIEQITLSPNVDKYDVLICDEAHKIITEKLLPLGKQTYRTNYGGSNIFEDNKQVVKGNTFYPDVKKTDPFITAIRDVRFYELIRDKIKYHAIFLTGTPIQKSMEDIVSITKFLNLKEINESNNTTFCKDVTDEAPDENEGFFNFLDGEKQSLHNNFMRAAIAKLYTFLQGYTGNQTKDVAEALNFPLEDIGIPNVQPFDRKKTPYNPNALGPIATAAARKKAEEEHAARMKPIKERERDKEIYENVYKRGVKAKEGARNAILSSSGLPTDLMTAHGMHGYGMHGGNNQLTEYVSNISETSLSLKSVINDIIVNSKEDIITTRPVINAIVADTGISEESIFQTINYLCRCLNGDFPYEESEKILNSENARKILEPLFGQYNIHESIISKNYSETNKNIGGKKNRKTIKKNNIYKNKKTNKKRNAFKNNTKVGGLLEIMDKEQLEIINKNINNEILVKELPILLKIQAINLELSLSPLSDYYIDKVMNSIMLKDIGEAPNNILGFELVIQPYLCDVALKWNHNNNTVHIEEIEENEKEIIGGDKQKEMLKLYLKQAVIDIFENLKKQRQGGTFTLTGLSMLGFNLCKSTVYKLFNLTGEAIINIPAAAEFSIKLLSKSLASFTESIIAVVIDGYNLDGMTKNILPFISIYNYDYISTAIDTKKFYEDLKDNNFNLSTLTNKNGTTSAFPKKYIENIYYPYSDKQLTKINQELDNGFSIKDAFQLTNIDFTDDKNAIITYIINEKLNNLSCGLGSLTSKEIAKDSAYKAMFKQWDPNYFDKYEREKEVLKNNYMEYSRNFLSKLSSTYGKQMYNSSYQISGGFFCTMDTNEIIKSKAPEWRYRKYLKLTRTPINITKTFQGPDNEVVIEQPKDELDEIDAAIDKASKDAISEDLVFAMGQGVPDYVEAEREEKMNELNIKREEIIKEREKQDAESWDKVYDTIKTEIDKTTKDLDKNVKFLTNGKYNDEEQSKFYNTLELLKIIRTGKLIHGGKFVYHPHYIKNGTSIEYYLPVVYPPTTEIMYGFSKFLDARKYKYIWLNNKLDPLDLDKQVSFSQILTFKVRNFTEDPILDPTKAKTEVNDAPICILISPNHKEGFSFTFNPALISLGLSETSGDEEQIYGRVLRKYGVDGFYGNYDKKIYQYFSGDNKDTRTLQNLVNLYSLSNTTLFRGMYNRTGFEKEGNFLPDWLDRIKEQVEFNINKAIDDLESSDIFVTDTTKLIAAKKTIGQQDWIRLTPKQKSEIADELVKKYFKNGFLNQEPQLSILYQVKTKSLDFFSRIAKKEHAEVTKTWGKWFSKHRDIFVPIAVGLGLGLGAAGLAGLAMEALPAEQEEETIFSPIDVEEMKKSSVEPKTYCIQNLKEPLYLENGKLNISSPIFCLNRGIPVEREGVVKGLRAGSKRKLTIKKNKQNKNKKTRKHKKY